MTRKLLELLQRISALLLHLQDSPGTPDDIRELAAELDNDVVDAINDNLN